MKLSDILLTVAAAFLLLGCSKNPEFRLDAVSEDVGTQNVIVRYVDITGTYHIEQIPAVDGKFSYVGRIDGPTYIEILDASNRLLGEFIADGGDEIKARFSVANPQNIKIEGNDDSTLLQDWLAKNRGAIMKGDAAAVNDAIETFVNGNPKQFASTALLLQYYTVAGYEEQALQLLQSINEKYRPEGKVRWFEQMLNLSMEATTVTIPDMRVYAKGVSDAGKDSAFVYTPRGSRLNLLIISDNESRGADSIRRMIEALESVRVIDLGMDRDTLLWGVSLRNLQDYPADVEHYWLPAGPATPGLAEAAPPAIPSFILTDSLGQVIYRTPSTADMQHFIIHKKH